MTRTQRMIAVLIAAALVGLAAYMFTPKLPELPSATPPLSAPGLDPMNATYMINGQPVTLTHGRSVMPAASGSADMVTTSVFGQQANGDLNDDGTPDAALIISQDEGGSGTFYYVVAAIAVPGGTKGTNAILLGDRVAPQGIEVENGQILASYNDRKPGQPFTAPPSVSITKYITYDGSALVAAGPTSGPGGPCGGNIMNAPVCVADYHCAPVPGSKLPFSDVGGTCVAN